MVKITDMFKIMSGISVILLFMSIFLIVDINIWQPLALPNLISDLSSYIKYGFNLMNQVLGSGFISMASSLFGLFYSIIAEAILNFNSGYYNSVWLSPPETPLPDYNQVLMDVYYFGFQILLLVGIISSLFFVYKLKSKNGIISFLCLQGIVVLAALFNNVNIGLTPIAGDLTTFFVSPILLYVLLSYLFLEIGFTANHVNDIFYESILQEKLITDKIQKLENIESETKDKNKAVQIKDFTVKIEDYKLSVYLDELVKSNPQIINKLSSKSVLPSTKNILKSFIVNSIIRIIVLILITYIIINPVLVLTILNAPLPLIESIEILTPEIVIILLIPISLIFPFSSLIISYLKNRNEKKLE